MSWQDDLVSRQSSLQEGVRRSEALVRRESMVQGHVHALHRERRLIEDKVGHAKARNLLKEPAKNVLDILRQRVHHRAVGEYEALLTSLMREVLPEQSEGRSIAITLSEFRDKTSMDFNVLREDGAIESVYDGNGGALTNVVSAGLRLIALSMAGRTLRQFMVFDEPDCWIAPARVPAFYRILAEASRSLGIQMVAIAHHDTAIFKSFDSHFVRLSPSEKGIQVDSDGVQWLPGQKGIRSIRLQNYRSHADSFITLGPEITMIMGVNNLGKSAVIDALRAICYGEAGDDVIRHGEDTAEVTIDLGESVLSWVRQRKGNPKEVYRLFSRDGVLLREENKSRGAPPLWVESLDVMGVSMVDHLDIQIAHQKKPVFLLDLKASERTGILSVGRESVWVDRMIEAYGKIIKEDARVIRQGEEKLTAIKTQLASVECLLEPVHVETLPDRARQSLQEAYQEKAMHEDVATLLNVVRYQRASLHNIPRPSALPLLDETLLKRIRVDIERSNQRQAQAAFFLKEGVMPSRPLWASFSWHDFYHLSKVQKISALGVLPDLPHLSLRIHDLESLEVLRIKHKALVRGLGVQSMAKLLAMPVLGAIDSFDFKDVARVQKAARIRSIQDLPIIPLRIDASLLAEIIQMQSYRLGLKKNQKLLHLHPFPPMPVLVAMQDVRDILMLMNRMKEAWADVQAQARIHAELHLEHEHVMGELEILKQEAGGICPLCFQPFSEEHHASH